MNKVPLVSIHPPLDIECPTPLLALDIPCPTPPVARPRGPHVPLMCAPQPRNLMVRYSGFSIRHTEFGIPESGIGKSDKLWRGSTHFARTPVNIGPDAVHIFLMVRYFPP